MGFLSPKRSAAPTPQASADPEEIRQEEETRIREENRQALLSQEERRRTLRGRLRASEDEDEGEIRRKRLFGE